MSISRAPAATLDDVKKRGVLNCVVSQGLQGFSDKDEKGEWTGFDVDFCRALAAAILDDPKKVAFAPLNAAERFEALRSGKIDVLSRNSTWTFEREATLGLLFAAITYHDGQGFLVARKPNIISALELDRTNVCVQKGTTSQQNAADYFRANSMTYTERAFDSLADAIKAVDNGQCDVFTADQSALYAERQRLSKPETAEVLPEVISKEPLGPAIRQGDEQWFNIVRWTLSALIDAEELGGTRLVVPRVFERHHDQSALGLLDGRAGRQRHLRRLRT